ncbi:MAG: hypothetical protein KDD41_00670 [Flavobacteriales bacterium]|nr:hypothetical protein [Flavobacteriales bacterium]
MKKLFLILLPLFLAVGAVAQGTVFEEARTIYKRESTFGVQIHTTGWGLTYRYGFYTSGFTKNLIEVDFIGKKHPKEIKTFSSLFDNSNGYVYGKLNSVLMLRGGVGRNVVFISKQSVRGIDISYVYGLGISLLYAKPSYLEIIKIDEDGLISSEIEKYNPDEHTQGDIIGGASYFRGFFSGKFYPGLYAKAGLNFESSFLANKINALEVGAVLDIYPKRIPIMANDLNRFYFFNLYVSLTFGSKKTE